MYFPELQESKHLRQTLAELFPLSYEMFNASTKNNCQLNSTFDQCFKRKLEERGFRPGDFRLPDGTGKNYQYDFAFRFGSGTVVFEVEKANHEKFLYDLLKAHIYLAAGAAFVVLVIPTERGRGEGINSFFDIARIRMEHCKQFGMISDRAFNQTILLGFDQQYQGRVFDQKVRDELHAECKEFWRTNPLSELRAHGQRDAERQG